MGSSKWLYENLPEHCKWVVLKDIGILFISASECPLRQSGVCSVGNEASRVPGAPRVPGVCTRDVNNHNRPEDCPNLAVN